MRGLHIKDKDGMAPRHRIFQYSGRWYVLERADDMESLPGCRAYRIVGGQAEDYAEAVGRLRSLNISTRRGGRRDETTNR